MSHASRETIRSIDTIDKQVLNIESARPLISPVSLKEESPLDSLHVDLVIMSRKVIRRIIQRKDRRLLAIVGPCSIHDRDSAIEYARRLSTLRERLSDRIYVIMRVYLEKPRTAVGWREMIPDPHLDGSHDISAGLREARKYFLISQRSAYLLGRRCLIRSFRNTSRISSLGRRLAPAPLGAKSTGSWRRAFRCPWDSRMEPMGATMLR